MGKEVRDKQTRLQKAVKLFLIAIKEGDVIVFPGNDSQCDYIGLLEEVYNNSLK
jgi:hypothetical protein